jgi:hypothetical protein
VTQLVTALNPDGEHKGLMFTGQVVQAAREGRPDIVGADASGPRVLIEAKFDAELTAAQVGTGYLEWLAPGQVGTLIYLVPANRMPAIWPQLLAGPCELTEVPPANLSHTDSPWLAQALGDGRVVGALSWETMIKRLHLNVDGSGDVAAIADLSQLEGVVEAYAGAGWIPLSAGDQPGRTGAQLWGLVSALQKAAYSVSKGKVTNASQDLGFGRWISTPKGRSIRVGLHLQAWAKIGLSPIWATVWTRDPVRFAEIYERLSILNAAGGPGVYKVDEINWGVPLTAPLGAEIGGVTEALATQCQRLAELLDTLPDEAAPDEDEPSSSAGDVDDLS